MKIETGDFVCFPGNPEERFEVQHVDPDDSTVLLHFEEDALSWIPDRLVRRVPPTPKPGEVWESSRTGRVFFICWVENGEVGYVFAEANTVVWGEVSVFGDGYERVYP